MSRVIPGKLLLETMPCDLLAVLEAAIDVVRPSATLKGIDLALVKPLDDCSLVGDPDYGGSRLSYRRRPGHPHAFARARLAGARRQ